MSSPKPPEEDIQWILQEVEKYLSPELRVRRSDVLSAVSATPPLPLPPRTSISMAASSPTASACPALSTKLASLQGCLSDMVDCDVVAVVRVAAFSLRSER